MTFEDVLAQALVLPENDRLELLDQLIESLDGPAPDDTEARWAAEVVRRLELYREGKLQTETMADAVSRLRRE